MFEELQVIKTERRRRAYWRNPKAYQKRTQAWKLSNKEKVKQSERNWREKNKEKLIMSKRAWSAKNRIRLRAIKKKWNNHKYKTDPQYKLAVVLRNRLGQVLLGKKKIGSFVRDLGCSIPELMKYLEKQFRLGMTWENHGAVWHIDHIKPLASFDLTAREQFLQACHFSNLQPLTVEENLRKNAKVA